MSHFSRAGYPVDDVELVGGPCDGDRQFVPCGQPDIRVPLSEPIDMATCGDDYLPTTPRQRVGVYVRGQPHPYRRVVFYVWDGER